MKLTAKQQLFCDEYLVDLNGTQAAIRAGYSAKTANRIANENLTKPDIQAYITERRKELQEKLQITQERVLAEYAKIGFSDIRHYFNNDGSLKALENLSDDAAGAVGSIEVDEIRLGEESIGVTKKLKMWNKREALDSICKVLGFNAPEKKEISGSMDFRQYLMEASTDDGKAATGK
jgi:phage terminase small subunit